jgi:hypothetical protein
MRKTIVALYDHMNDAEQSVRDLVDSGIPRDQISLVASNPEGQYTTDTGEGSGAAQGAGVGAGIGAALGGIGGLLVGLGALAIPGIGPVLAAGPLAAALGGVAGAGAGAIAGGAAGGLIGGLTDAGVSEEQAGNFAEGVRRGGSLVTVMTDDTFSSQAKDILNRHHPIDVNDRSTQWRQSGWTGFNPSGESYTTRTDQELGSTTHYGGPSTTGAATGSGNFDTGRALDEDEMGNSGMGAASMGDTGTYSSSNNPQPTGSGYTGVSGDVGRTGMGSDASERNFTRDRDMGAGMGSQSDLGSQTGYGIRDFDSYTNDFQNHYSNYFGQRGYTYNDYIPAYQYGYDLANNQRFQGSDWTVIESDARTSWEERHPGTWEQFKDAVHHAWQSVRDSVS